MSLDIVHNERRKLLQASVCAMLLEQGVQNAPNSVVETLVEMVQSLICELSRSAQSYSELCGRSNPLFVDVFIAMIEMGLRTYDLVSFGKRKTRYHIPTPQTQPKQPAPRILQVGDKRSLFSYIPDYFPSFPGRNLVSTDLCQLFCELIKLSNLLLHRCTCLHKNGYAQTTGYRI